MTIRGEWSSLLDSGNRSSHLLVKFSTSDDGGYDLLATDLKHLWKEELSFTAVVDRAEDLSSGIDPTDNRDRFLREVANALGAESHSSISITAQQDDLLIELSAPLPKPLPPLCWRFELNLEGSEGLLDHVIGPLVAKVQHQAQESRALMSLLGEKDHVITKLLDRLESSGTDLTSIFPGTSNVKLSRKGSQRGQLHRHVKGLEPFQHELWQSPHATTISDTDVEAALHDVSSRVSDDWDVNFGIGTEGENARGKPSNRQSDGRTAPLEQSPQKDLKADTVGADGTAAEDLTDGTETDDDDDFQVQHISSSQPPGGGGTADTNDATHENRIVKDEPKSQEAAAEASALSSQKTTTKTRGKLGMIGGKKGALEDAASTSGAIPSEPPAPTQAPEEAKNLPPKVKGRIGMIGGRRRAKGEEGGEGLPSPSESPSLDSDKRSAPTATVARGPATTEIAVPERGRSAIKGEDPGESAKSNETSQERADRRREELKRQLDKKPVAAAKKKRRF